MLKEFFRLSKGKASYLEKRQLLLEIVDTMYGIVNHSKHSGALGLVRYTDVKNYNDHYLEEAYLELYLYKSINKHYGLSFDEFLDRPRYEIDKMVKVVSNFMAKENSVTEDIVKDFENASKR